MRPFRTPFVVSGLCLALAACRDSAPCTGTPCGTAVILAVTDAGILFPPVAEGTLDKTIIDQVYLRLAHIGPGLNTVGDSGFVPELASSWKFDDPRTLTFQMDPRARWQDGVPVTAQDVAFTFDVYRDPAVNSTARATLAVIESVTATSDRTVVFKFSRTYPEAFYDATYHMRIVPRHLMDSIPRARLASHPLAHAPVGNGPYRLLEWKTGQSIELIADSTFFLGRPGLARLIWRTTPDYPTAMAQLQAGEADIMEYLGPPENVELIRTVPTLRVVEYPTTTYIFVDLNLNDRANLGRPHPLFGDRGVRQALFQALDRRQVVNASYGKYSAVAVGPIGQHVALGRDTTIPHLPHDTAAARQTLAGLGWRDSNGDGILDRAGRKFEFELLVPVSSLTRQRAAEVIKEQLKPLGIVANINRVEFNLFRDRTQKRRYDAAMMNWTDDPTPSSIQQTLTTAAIGGSNYRGYRSPEFDRLVRTAVDAPTPAVALARWRDVYTLANQDLPGLWLAAPTNVAAVHTRFQNVSFAPDQWAAWLWTWRVTPGREIPRDLPAATP